MQKNAGYYQQLNEAGMRKSNYFLSCTSRLTLEGQCVSLDKIHTDNSTYTMSLSGLLCCVEGKEDMMFDAVGQLAKA